MSDYEIRFSRRKDLSRIQEIERLSISPGASDQESTFERMSVDKLWSGHVMVASSKADPDSVLGYLWFHRVRTSSEYYIERLAVHPESRARGIGRELVKALILHASAKRGSDEPSFSMTVSPQNTNMLRVALSNGFAGTEFLAGFRGPGQDCIYLRRPLSPFCRLGESIFLPIDSASELSRLIVDGYILTDVERLPSGLSLHLCKRTEDEPSTLDSTETQVSFGVAAALLGVFTFLFGLALQGNRVPEDIIAFLGFGLLSATLSMLVYGKSSGELARLRTGLFAQEMRIGNLVSEFGGYYPIILIVPVEIARVSNSESLGALLCGLAVVALGWYHLSGLSMLDRYRMPFYFVMIAKVLITISPALAFVEIGVANSTTWWSICNIVFLSLCTLVAMAAGGERVGPATTANKNTFRSRLLLMFSGKRRSV